VKPRAGDSGFTLVEAAAALALLCLVAGLATAFYSGGAGALERARGASAQAAILLETEAALRDALGQVRIPYWERQPALRFADGEVSIPYFKGEAGTRLELDWEARSLNVGGRRFAPVEVLGTGTLVAPSGETQGIVVTLAVGGRPCPVAARFGQSALRLGKE
jgi:hypothetical protein